MSTNRSEIINKEHAPFIYASTVCFLNAHDVHLLQKKEIKTFSDGEYHIRLICTRPTM